MRLAEQLVTINARHSAALIRARQHPPVGVRGASGVKRDRAIAKAEREYYESLRRLGIRTRRRHVRA